MQLDAATMSVPTGRFIHEEWPYEPRLGALTAGACITSTREAAIPSFYCTAIPLGDSCIGNL